MILFKRGATKRLDKTDFIVRHKNHNEIRLPENVRVHPPVLLHLNQWNSVCFAFASQIKFFYSFLFLQVYIISPAITERHFRSPKTIKNKNDSNTTTAEAFKTDYFEEKQQNMIIPAFYCKYSYAHKISCVS